MLRRIRNRGEEGQVLPVLLSLVIAILAITMLMVQLGRAGDLRTRAQTAADAAALAAAAEIRNRAIDLTAQGILPYGTGYDPESTPAAARAYAKKNGAVVEKVERSGIAGRFITVTVRSGEAQGGELDPKKRKHARAEAIAVVEFPGCYIATGPPRSGGQGGDDGSGSVGLVCGGERVGTVNPHNPNLGPVADGFEIRLVDEAPPQYRPAIPPIGGGGVSNQANRELGKRMAAGRGWTGRQWRCLDELWQHESGWDHTATNPTSGAYGIPQSLPASKMVSAGADWLTNPATQIAWGLDYIARRYGTPCNAWGAWQARSPHWY